MRRIGAGLLSKVKLFNWIFSISTGFFPTKGMSGHPWPSGSGSIHTLSGPANTKSVLLDPESYKYVQMLLIALAILGVNLAYWVFLFSRVGRYREKTEQSPVSGHLDAPVWLVIAARNESDGLRKSLPLLLNQHHPDYRVLLIDDHSTDDTEKAVNALEDPAERLQYVRNDEHLGKKRSLHEQLTRLPDSILVFTDGDCQPVSKDWLALMTGKMGGEQEIVLGYAPFVRESSWINRFARFENVLTGLQYLSYALAGMPYMGVGRNLAYRKRLFDQQQGFSRHLDIRSGDDDLFVQSAANARNTAIQIDPRSFMYSPAPSGLAAFIRQKRRHISSAPRYRFGHKLLLSLFAFSHIAGYLSLFFIAWQAALSLYILRLTGIWLSNRASFRKLQAGDLLPYLPVLDVLLLFYYPVLGFLAIFPIRKGW